jgi:hypothetical protein
MDNPCKNCKIQRLGKNGDCITNLSCEAYLKFKAGEQPQSLVDAVIQAGGEVHEAVVEVKMDRLLSDEELQEIYVKTRMWPISLILNEVAKAAAIHAVQFMEGECLGHGIAMGHHFPKPRRQNCPECREKYHKVLGI